MAAGTKRANDDSAAPKAKKTKVEHKTQTRQSLTDKPAQPASSLVADEVDLPRGGGTSFTPLEVKAIRAEAVKEANEELFRVSSGYYPVQADVHIIYRIMLLSRLQEKEESRSRRRRTRRRLLLTERRTQSSG